MSKFVRIGLCLVALLLLTNLQASMPSLSNGAGFQPNLGQMDEQVAFWAQRNGIDLFVTQQGELVHRFHGGESRDWVLIERLEHAALLQPQAAELEGTQITVVSKDGSQTAFTSRQIMLGEAWPGIHAELQLADGHFEKRFHLKAGADVNAIRVSLDGVDDLSIAADGRLILGTGLGEVELSAPIAWQEIGQERKAVDVQYTLASNSSYGFVLGEFDPAFGVTIDPVIRSTFVGGNGDEAMDHLEVASDSVYITGNTGATNFPGTTGGYQPGKVGSNLNVYIARYSLDLTTLLHATYFGKHASIPGAGQSASPGVRTIAVTADSVYITGSAPGAGDHVPATVGALQTTPGGDQSDAYIARFSRDLSQLLAATYYGGSSSDTAWPLAVAADGVYISGHSGSTNLAGLANGANNTAPVPANTGAAFVAKLSLDLSSVVAASWISGGGWDMEPRAMVLGPDGSVYVGGDGSRGLFETTGALQPNRSAAGATADGFIVRLNSDLSVIHRSTYIGSAGGDRIDSLAFADGKLFVAGKAGSSSFPVPETGAVTLFQANTGFIASVAPDLSAVTGGSYYRGNVTVSIAEVLVDGSDVFLTGTTTSTELPATEGAQEPTSIGGTCGFAAIFNTALTEIQQSTFMACGGSTTQVFGADFGNNTLYVSGRTQRSALPGSDTGAQPARASGGSYDAFIIASTSDLAGPKPNADIEVLKVGSETRVGNEYVYYLVSVTNNGPDDATEVLIEDTLPEEIALASWQCSGFDGASCPNSSGGGDISETAAIPDGGRLEYEICGYVGFSNTVSNTATASVPSHTLDPEDDNNSDTAIIQDPRLFADGFEEPDLPPWCPQL